MRVHKYPSGSKRFGQVPESDGHRIPIDPPISAIGCRHAWATSSVLWLAHEVNRSMPQYVAARAQDLLNELRLPVKGSRVLILGVTYKPGIADQRESPAQPLGLRLLQMGASLNFYDPFVREWDLGGLTLQRVATLPTRGLRG